MEGGLLRHGNGTGSQWSYFNSSPALSRTGVALAFDDIRGVVTLFGGFGAYPMNDTWILEGNMWRQLTPAVSPPVRDRAAMVYDSDRGNIILFGGGDNNYVYLNDTWEWDGANWSEKIAASPPPGRSGHAMAYDSSRKKVILFGGSGTTDQRTWEWDGSTWKDGAPVKSPPVRTNHVMEYDPVRNQVVLFGGSDPTNRDIKYNDTWVYEHLKIEMVSFEYRLNPKQTINIPIDLDGSKVPLDLAITGLPNGVNATLSQSSSIIPPSQAVLQLVAGPRVSLGTYPVTVSASTDIQSTSLQFNLTVAKKSKR